MTLRLHEHLGHWSLYPGGMHVVLLWLHAQPLQMLARWCSHPGTATAALVWALDDEQRLVPAVLAADHFQNTLVLWRGPGARWLPVADVPHFIERQREYAASLGCVETITQLVGSRYSLDEHLLIGPQEEALASHAWNVCTELQVPLLQSLVPELF